MSKQDHLGDKGFRIPLIVPYTTGKERYFG